MPTVVKTFNFASNAQGLADAASSGVTFAWQSADSQSGSGGCVKFTFATKASTSTEFARNPNTGETWETWGVPAGDVVSAVQVTAWYAKTAANLKLSSHSVSARVIGSGGASVHSAGDLVAAAGLSTATTAWVSQSAGTQRAVDQGSQASTTDVRLELQYTVTTSGGGGSASTDARLDEISITITHDSAPTEHAASAEFTGASSLTASMTRETFASAALTGAGSLTAAATRETFMSVGMTGEGSLTASATVGAGATEHQAEMAVDGEGVLAANATRETFASASIQGEATVSATATRETFASAALTGAGEVVVAKPARETFVSASIQGASSLSVKFYGDPQKKRAPLHAYRWIRYTQSSRRSRNQ